MGKKSKGWLEGTNLSHAPNAQGTLFQGGNAYIADKHRYQRGYTPERRDAVKAAARFVGPGEYGKWSEPKVRERENKGANAAVENIARSTVPIEHLTGVSVQVLHPDLYPHRRGISDGAGGTYTYKSNLKVPGEILVREDVANEPTLIHEVGHHVSRMSGTEHSAYKTPSQRGAEEGFADRYAEEHFRHDKDQGRWNNQGQRNYTPYPDQITDSEGNLHPEQFHEAYNQTRPKATRLDSTLDDLNRRAAAEKAHKWNNPTLPGMEGMGYR